MIFKLPLLVILPSFAAPFFTSIMEVPLLVKVPVMFRLFFVLPLNLAPCATSRLPFISIVSPSAVRLPLAVTFPFTIKAPLCLSKFALLRVALVPCLTVTLPFISVGAFWEPRVMLPPSKIMFCSATTPFLICESVPSICLICILPPVAFKVKLFFIKKAVFVEPELSRFRVDPSETLKFLEFIITPEVG
ncbi:hypothetical protein BVZ87_01320 [Haemophilus influenzae]|nr:hypothetical protein BVZ87_01320 [Haemophilus influenzae]